MRILITPLILKKEADSCLMITRQLISFFQRNGHTCAACIPSSVSFADADTYASPVLPRNILYTDEDMHIYEEWLFHKGALKKKYLREDLEAILEAISEFHPDLVLTMHRLSAVIAARKSKINCWAFVDSAIYRNGTFDAKYIRGLNEILSENHMEQEFTVRDLYEKCNTRIMFMPESIQPYPQKNNNLRIHSCFMPNLPSSRVNRVCIFLSEIGIRKKKLHKMIYDAFAGASVQVYIWYPGCEKESEDNLHFLSSLQPDLISGSITLIHDGGTYLYQLAAFNGIPQIIISDHTPLRNYHALSAQRNGIALYLYEEELSVSSLWEIYKRLLADDMYYENAKHLRGEMLQMDSMQLLESEL